MRCPHCDAPAGWWHSVPVIGRLATRGRCASCHTKLPSLHPLVTVMTVAAFLAVAWFFIAEADPGPTVATVVVIVAYLFFVTITVGLTMIDLETHLLPNAIVLPSYAVATALLTLACVLGADWSALLRGAIAMAALWAFYFLLRLVSPRGMGGGDVKLAGVIGLYLGWMGWGAVLLGVFSAFALGGLFGVGLLLTRRAGRRTAIPFGPWMLLGAWVGIFAGEAIARMYAAGPG